MNEKTISEKVYEYDHQRYSKMELIRTELVRDRYYSAYYTLVVVSAKRETMNIHFVGTMPELWKRVKTDPYRRTLYEMGLLKQMVDELVILSDEQDARQELVEEGKQFWEEEKIITKNMN